MITKREEADQRRQKREEERRKKYEQVVALHEEKDFAKFVARYKGMDEGQILNQLKLEAALRERRFFRMPKAEFAWARKLFEEHGIAFTEKNLRLVSPALAKDYCVRKLFNKLLNGDWTEFRARLLKRPYVNIDEIADIGPPTEDEKRFIAERYLKSDKFHEAEKIFEELGDAEAVGRIQNLRLNQRHSWILCYINEERFDMPIMEQIEEMPLEMRRELRLAFAKAVIAKSRNRWRDHHDLSWYTLVEYVHTHSLEELYEDVAELTRRYIDEDPRRVAEMALVRRYFQPTKDEIRLLYTKLLHRGIEHLPIALDLLKEIHSEDSEEYRVERQTLMLKQRQWLLNSQRYAEAEDPAFDYLPPIKAKDLYALRDSYQIMVYKNPKLMAMFARLVAREQAVAD